MRFLSNAHRDTAIEIITALKRGHIGRKIVEGEPGTSKASYPLEKLKQFGMVGLYEVEAGMTREEFMKTCRKAGFSSDEAHRRAMLLDGE